jgi:predicted GNAT family acetyltransferase
MEELCRRLLRRHGVVTLHVNEANLPAVRVYENAGFERQASFRLITVPN